MQGLGSHSSASVLISPRWPSGLRVFNRISFLGQESGTLSGLQATPSPPPLDQKYIYIYIYIYSCLKSDWETFPIFYFKHQIVLVD